MERVSTTERPTEITKTSHPPGWAIAGYWFVSWDDAKAYENSLRRPSPPYDLAYEQNRKRR
jgi:hypothetical protein